MKEIIEELKKVETSLVKVEQLVIDHPYSDDVNQQLSKYWFLSLSVDDLRAEIARTRDALERKEQRDAKK